MPKLVLVNTVCSGSHGRLMRDLRSAAQANGFQVCVAYGRGDPFSGDTVRIGAQKDVLAHVALTRALDMHGRGSRGATEAFVRHLSDLSPDLLHLHNIHGYYLHAQTLFDFIRERNLPTLWTLHDCWALTGHCSHFTRAYCARWQNGCHDCPLKREYPASFGLDASRRNWQWKKDAFSTVPTLRLVTPSLWLSDVVRGSYLGQLPRRVVPNGIDLSLFRPVDGSAVRESLGVEPDQALLLCVARPFDARKGYADMLRVAERLKEKARVVMIGLSDRQLRSLPPYVIGLSGTDGPEELVPYYAAADCLVNPTYEDTYPTVNMEALACATPVVGYGVGGAKEQLADPVGLPLPVGNPDLLADSALRSALKKKSLSPLCRRYAEQHFDRGKAIGQYIEIYHQMTGDDMTYGK